ncbi:hypothetical protein DSM3645_28327 [Blastopirellula marina DSM 3645]|uniref:Sulfotransferase family protein n=2 Tax=Blastopirellula marina TaxID=124 RepID=A3ZP87_9BACT|nr:hypothetical protein DSM3645_28327 [Blastopirellula marina DSM 3645]
MDLLMFRRSLARFKKRPLYFLHINKTAGTTVTAAFGECMRRKGVEQYLLRERICGPQEFEGLRSLPADRIDSYSLYRGHFGLLLPQIIQRPCRIVTILRDPVRRIVSHYHHIKRSPDRKHHQRIVGGKMSLLDCLEDEVLRPIFWNMQVRHLGWSPLISREKLLQFDYEPWDDPQSLPCAEDEQAMVKRAKETIDQAEVVGVTEQLPKFFGKVAKTIEIPFQPPSNRRMVGEYSAELSPSEISQIQECCNLDQELYDYVRSRVERTGG